MNTKARATDILTISLPTYITPLLLPNVSIAEIINLESVKKADALPFWCAGLFDWRGQDIPLIAFETFSDQGFSYPLNSNHRIAVINSITESVLPAYAFLSKGIPKLLRLRPTDIEDLEGVAHESEQIRVLINNEETIIPNLRYLEQMTKTKLKN